MTSAAGPVAAASTTWGGFTLAGMSLALPLQALREVLPLGPLTPLPTTAPAVKGAIDVRGVRVPVLDVGTWLQREPAGERATSVLLAVHQGRLVGLLVDTLTGVFVSAADTHSSARPPTWRGGEALAFAGSLRRGDTGEIVTLLSLDALAGDTTLPWIDDPEPDRQHLGDRVDGDTAAGATPPDRVALMRVRCGTLSFAIETMAIQGAMWTPSIEPSPLAMGACRGTVVFGDRRIGALDLLAVCGLGERQHTGGGHALVLRDSDGLAAVLVDEVIEIVDVPVASVCPMPARALPGEGLLRGVWARREGDAAGTVFVLDARALVASETVQAMTRTNVALEGAAVDAVAAVAGAAVRTGTQTVITLRLPAEVAVPMAQVREILPYSNPAPSFADGAALRKIEIHDGRAMPVFCLAHVLRGQPADLTPSSAILVVDDGDDRVGFAVPALGVIARTVWERTIDTGRLAGLNDENGERTLQVIDLQALAV